MISLCGFSIRTLFFCRKYSSENCQQIEPRLSTWLDTKRGEWGLSIRPSKTDDLLCPSAHIYTLQWQDLFMCLLCPYKPVTWHRTAKDLHSHADVAAVEPRARVDPNVAADHRHWEDVPDWDLFFSVAAEDLLRQTHSTRWWIKNRIRL